MTELAPNSAQATVLVADDSPEALSMLNECLVKQGYTVLVAMDGTQVLAIAGRITPDIIILDAMMPNMDGFEACRELKRNTELCDVPVVFMTGLSDSEHVIMGLEVGGVDYINKPVNLDELAARIRVHLKNSRSTRSARNALDEIGQLAFACDINGGILWSTVGARRLLIDAAGNDENISSKDEKTLLEVTLAQQIRQWLQRDPMKNTALALQDLAKPLQVKFIGLSAPGEYLLKLLEDNEVQARHTLRQQFDLTEREAEVLFWLARGKTNREIAQILSMSPRTVNKHLEPVFKKLGVENRTSAAAICLQLINK